MNFSNNTTINFYEPFLIPPGSLEWYIVIRIFSGILFLLGLFGNVTSFIIFNKKHMKGTSTSIYLRALAISDTCSILEWHSTGLFFTVEPAIINDPDLMLKLICIAAKYLRKIFQMTSSLLLCAMTIDRSIFILIPTKAKMISTKKTTLIIIILIFVCIAGCHSIFIQMFNNVLIVADPNDKWTGMFFCLTKNKFWKNWYDNITPVFEIMFQFIVPCGVFFVTNSLMLYHLIGAEKKRNQLTNTSKSNTSSKGSNSTRILLIISSYYILVSIPNITLFIYVRYILKNPDVDDGIFLKKTGLVVRTLAHSNNCLNFYFFCLSGRKFREEFLNLFRRTKNISNSTKTNQLSSTN